MTFTPFDFQRKDLDTLRANNFTALVNAGTGSGKTLAAVWAIQDAKAEVALVVAPAQTMESAWKSTVREVLGIEAREIGNSTKVKREALFDFEFGEPGVYLVTPQLVSRKSTDISEWRGDFLVLDESHLVMTPGTSAQRRISGYTVQEGENALCRRFTHRLALSGTALRNKFDLAWSYGRTLWWWLDKRDEPAYSNYYVWSQDRQASYMQPTGQLDRDGNYKKVRVFTGEAEQGRWISEAPCVITHLKRENCCEFHPNGYLPLGEPTVIHETIPLSREQKKAIHELEEFSLTYLEENPLVVEIPLTQKQRIRQMTLGVPTIVDDEVTFDTNCKSPMIDRLMDLLDNEISGETCVVYTDSQKFASVVTARLNAAGVSAFEYSGKTRDVRDSNVEKFGSEFRVMVGVLAASGTGIDGLQKVCQNEVWLSRDLDQTTNEQAEGRTDRFGQTGQVMRWIFHDDEGISEGDYGRQIAQRIELNKSLRKVV